MNQVWFGGLCSIGHQCKGFHNACWLDHGMWDVWDDVSWDWEGKTMMHILGQFVLGLNLMVW